MSAVDSLVPRIGGVIDKHIRPMFKGAPRITVLVRFEDSAEADVIVTSDDDEGIRAIVERRTQPKDQS